MVNFKNSKVDRVKFRDRDYYIKRDDLIDRDFNGNKARKLYYYLNSDLSKFKRVVSFGGNQSNAMYSISAFAKLKNLEFIYYLKPLPKYLKQNPIGNFKFSLENKMRVVESLNFPKQDEFDSKTLFIEQGVKSNFAKEGVKLLAKEIEEFKKSNRVKKLSIVLPSGTGTTALYLQKYLSDIRVYTTALIGDSNYLLSQFKELESDSSFYPTILDLEKKYHFGKLYREFLEIYFELKEATNIEFELLYDPKSWIVLDSYREKIEGEILYIHSGGVLGNESMLERYRRKFKGIF